MRPRVTLTLFLLAVSSVVVPSVATAQGRQGFWFGVGGGFGSADVTCDDCTGDREGSGAGYLRLGWTLNERVLIGGEFNVWAKSFALEDGLDATASLYNFSGSIAFYPTTSGFFVKGGAGASTADLEFKVTGTNVTVEIGTGFGFLAGAGYDVRVSRNVSITPAVNYWYG